MAHILKSNVAVNDPNDRYAYYTPYGVATQELSAYVSALETTGYTMSQAEFNGFKTFIKNLTDNLIWDKVYEVYPLFGKNLDGALNKLKSKNGINKLAAVDGFDNSMLEIVNDKVKGKGITTISSSSNAPRLDTGLALSEVLPSVGMHAYFGNAQITGSLWQPVMGVAAALDGNSFDSLTQLAVNTNTGTSQIGAAVSHPTRASAETFTNTPSIIGYQGVPNQLNISSKGVFYKDGIKTGIVAAVNNGISDTTATLALFGRNAPHAAVTGAGYSGIVRFACITSGYLDDTQVATLHSEINKLLISLGKIA